MRFFGDTLKARFISRPNRFTAVCELEGSIVNAYLPNPGRPWELLHPGVPVYLEKNAAKKRKLAYTVVAVIRDNRPVMLHTHKTNHVARRLIECSRIPGLEDAEIIKSEVSRGRSRFDFQLKKGGAHIFLEVKSCTLFGKNVAMFPDAVTARGKKHVEELSMLSKNGTKGVVLFIINSLEPDFFMPEYHTDLAFTRALLAAKNQMKVIPIGVGWNDNLTLKKEVKLLEVPWKVVELEADDKGAYLLILRLSEDKTVGVGGLGKICFEKGYYIYVGSAKKNLSKRIERHRRLRKKMHWHIDYLRQACDFQATLLIRTRDDIECDVAGGVNAIADFKVPGFGSSDCSCQSHLFHLREDPLKSCAFHSVLQYFRMERPVKKNVE
jgi:sugar fermentation stimulation protein A